MVTSFCNSWRADDVCKDNILIIVIVINIIFVLLPHGVNTLQGCQSEHVLVVFHHYPHRRSSSSHHHYHFVVMIIRITPNTLLSVMVASSSSSSCDCLI